MSKPTETQNKCEWEGCCDCSSFGANKDKQCEKCSFYYCVDSGYGYCRALPQFIVVAWCRDACSLFKEEPKPSNVIGASEL